MKLSGVQWALVGILAIAGIYLLVFHKDPLPFNHEAVGLGTLHLVHDVIAVVLFALVGLIVWRARKAAPASPPTA